MNYQLRVIYVSFAVIYVASLTSF